jgi:hypothetical protein
MSARSVASTQSDAAAILAEVSAERLAVDTAAVARTVRLSGTPDERPAFAYIADELAKMGLEPRTYECETYISLPGAATCEVVAPDRLALPCITHSMARPTDGLEAELVDVGGASADDWRAKPAAGKIALIDGVASPGKVRAAERAGCFAQVFVNDQRLHEMIVSGQYGSPTPQTVGDLPRSVCVSVTEESGQKLRALLARGPVRLRLRTEVETRWRKIPLVVADLMPSRGDGTFVFWGTHVDSWHYGATDNAAGNAAELEIARVMARHRDALRRGVRFLFWSGHSHGRYAGSCWYVDHFWQDLYDHAIAGMAIDSPGGRGATDLGGSKTMDELKDVAAAATTAVTSREVKTQRPKGGEQPLWRVGVSSINPAHSRQRAGSPTSMGFESASGYWHHSTEDTLENMDPEILRQDTRIYLHATWTLATSEILPLDYAETARALRAELAGLPESGIDLSEAIALAARLEESAASLRHGASADRVNDALRQIGRVLIPAIYTLRGQFEPDSTLEQGYLPGLAGLKRLASLDPASDEAATLRTGLVRQRNRLVFALRTAVEIAREGTQ